MCVVNRRFMFWAPFLLCWWLLKFNVEWWKLHRNKNEIKRKIWRRRSSTTSRQTGLHSNITTTTATTWINTTTIWRVETDNIWKRGNWTMLNLDLSIRGAFGWCYAGGALALAGIWPTKIIIFKTWLVKMRTNWTWKIFVVYNVMIIFNWSLKKVLLLHFGYVC